MALPASPHDALFRALLDDPDRAAALIRDLLPAPLRRDLTADPPEPVEGSFIDDALRATRSDRLFRLRLARGGEALVYVLLEHKSAPDPATPLQLLGYMARIWERHAGGAAARLRALPPIVPVVVYHGAAPWTVPLSVTGCLAGDGPWVDRARSLRYILHDLGRIDAAALSGDRAVRAVLSALKLAFTKSVAAEALEEVLAALPDGHPLELRLLVYIMRVHDTTRAAVETALRRTRPDRWEALMGTVGEEFFREGLSKGKMQGLTEGKMLGLTEGKIQGLTEGKAAAVLRVLAKRFGPVEDAVARAVRRADAAQLDSMLDRALTATRPRDVLPPDETH